MVRKKYSKELKAQIALDAIKKRSENDSRISIRIWRSCQSDQYLEEAVTLDAAPAAFSNGKDKDAEKKEVERDHLYQKVGQLQIEVDWLKKKTGYLG